MVHCCRRARPRKARGSRDPPPPPNRRRIVRDMLPLWDTRADAVTVHEGSTHNPGVRVRDGGLCGRRPSRGRPGDVRRDFNRRRLASSHCLVGPCMSPSVAACLGDVLWCPHARRHTGPASETASHAQPGEPHEARIRYTALRRRG